MMSQVEIWSMQEYCNRRNSRREKRILKARKARLIYAAMGFAFVLGCLCVPIVLAWGL